MSGTDQLRRHVEECDECRSHPPAIDRIDRALASSRIAIDSSALSRLAMAAARPVLQASAMRLFWRQVAAVIVVALVPLPMIVAYDTVLLGLLHVAVSAVLPSAVAAYVVFMYASSLLFLFAVSYAAIPVLMARNAMPNPSTHG
jgi:hypothetical protein